VLAHAIRDERRDRGLDRRRGPAARFLERSRDLVHAIRSERLDRGLDRRRGPAAQFLDRSRDRGAAPHIEIDLRSERGRTGVHAKQQPEYHPPLRVLVECVGRRGLKKLPPVLARDRPPLRLLLLRCLLLRTRLDCCLLPWLWLLRGRLWRPLLGCLLPWL
jgi:hypothetical protein